MFKIRRVTAEIFSILIAPPRRCTCTPPHTKPRPRVSRSTSCRFGQRRVFGWIVELLLVNVVWRALLLPGYGSSYRVVAFDQLAVTQFGSNSLRACDHVLRRIAG